MKLIARLERKSAMLVSGSAIGWYGLWQDQVLTESAKSHACFSHEFCDTWEKAARPAEELGVVRLVRLPSGSSHAPERRREGPKGGELGGIADFRMQHHLRGGEPRQSERRADIG